MKTQVTTIFILLCTTSCSFFSSKNEKEKGTSLSFSHDSSLIVDGKMEVVKAGEVKSIAEYDFIRVEAKGKVPLLIYPIKMRESTMQVDLPSLSTTHVNETQMQAINSELDIILPEVQKVQNMILQRDYTNALSKIRDLKLKYPKVAFFSFLEGACYKVMNKSSESATAIREGLDLYPGSAEAKELYRQVSGKESP